MSALSIASLISFFGEEQKSIKKGENHYKSSHVESFTYSQCILRGDVHASMRNKVYKVTVYLDSENAIRSSDCECPRGKFKCSHAAALFIHGIYNLSRTDVECNWRKRKANTPLSWQAVEEMFPPTKQYSCLSRNPTQSDRSALYRDLQEYGRFTGLCWLMSPEPASVSKLPISTIEDIIYSEDFLKTQGLQQQIDCLVRQAKIPDEYILKISDITTGQRNNPSWHLTRRGRLTASNFGCVLKAKRVTQSLLKRLLGEYDLSGVKAVQWGVNNEQEALKAFTVLSGKTVQETGIWLDASGILGASPDGIVDHETVLEAKCPYTERNLTIEEAIATSPTFCLEKARDGNGYVLKKDHVYWDQEYQVAYVIIKTGNAPRPGTWALEKSVDGGKMFTPWQYFATTNSECLNYFGISSLLQSFKDDTTVTCTTSYSQVPPFENGKIHISLVNGRPGAANFSYSQALQEWTRATHIRLRLLKVKTLLADLLPLARQDPTVTRRYFYSIKDISVGGICMCNGHADDCVQWSQNESSQFVCRCNHQTCGIKCERCCPGFVQKPWRPATPDSSNKCEPCNCHNHATDCYYNEAIAQGKRSLDINGNYEGGGVCVNCLHNTYGINCERCKPGYYRPTGVPKTSRDVCQACTCSGRFSTGRCFDGDGQCKCLENFSGPRCNQCNEGFYGFPNCKPCDCHPLGTSGRVCGPSGDQCPCNPGYTGAKCDQCDSGYYGFPNCRKCNCDNVGALTPNVCDVNTGQCTCHQMYTSRQCNQCSRGFYSFPECKVCNCDAEGTARDICDPNTGVCICMNNSAGPRCEVCNEGYFRFPACDDCSCSSQGSVSPNCSQFGVCDCQENYDGLNCERCKVGYYNYPRCVKCACNRRGSQHQFCDPSTGQCICKGSFRGVNCDLCRSGYYGFPDCRACQCNPAGIKPLPDRPLGDCSLSNEGQCDCKDNVQGLACTECKGDYYNLQGSNPLGCDNCDCNLDGVIGGIRSCDKVTGQCTCKLYVTGRRCTSCKPGFYGLAGRKVFGCTGCGCDVGGAFNQWCDTLSGQCKCRANVTGRDCSRPIPLHYYPTLLHIKAELEDGTTAPTKQGSDVLSSDGSPARFGFDESVFPGYSWRGYATMSDLQRALKVTMDIPKAAHYHIVFHYMLNGSSPVTGEVMFMPKGGVGSKQSSEVTFPVTQAGPAHLTVGEADQATQFMLTKGKWDLMLLLPPASILFDYVVALPQEYYEAYQLEEKVTKPCQVNGIDSLCNQFSYLSTRKPGLFTSELETGYIITRGSRQDTQLFKNESVQEQLDFTAMALLNRSQNRVTADFSIPKHGKYVLVIQYYKPSDGRAPLTVYLRYPRGTQRGDFNLQSCNYRFGCRQVAVDPSGAVKVFDVKQLQRMVVTLLSRSSAAVAVDSITAIPLDMWTLDFIAPNILCTTTGGVCIPTSYPIPKGAVKIEADDDDPSEQQPPKQDPSTKLQYLQGPKKHTLSGSVRRPGKYAVIVQYYQPMHSSFGADVSVTSDRAVDGNVKFHYCPHTSGCRSVVRDSSAASSFNIGRTFVDLEFDIPVNSSTWIDYVLLVPEDAFSSELQEDSPVPRTQEFLDSCSKDHFFIKPSDPQFCKDSVFSLTTSFNNGSFACDCNRRGSYNNDCEEFGGQCSCRPNVIGRTCSRCRTGYYGFPNCRKCSCVFCNEITGVCDCPPNTVGPNCGSCLQGTYGHDPILGCQNCECERNGVIGGNIACDSKTGQCNCKLSHTGRQCNKCATGYYNYPLCQKCEFCDPRGVSERVCDGDNGQCFCKPGVNGERCDKCLAGHFNLDVTNPNGCTKCWCNGLSDTCFEGVKFWSKVNSMDGWTIENTPASVTKIGADELYAGISSQRNEKDKPVYWVAPKEYLGKKISSYGGKLTYTVEYMVPQGSRSPLLTKKPDVVMEGKNGKVLHYKNQLELSPGQSTSVEAQLLEYLWEDESRSNITRADFMSVLLNIKSLKLRATYSTEVAETTLSGVVMNVAVDGPVEGAARAKSVELCECPERATGASCELCGKGYTRGADNSSCIPCNCFRHSDDCNDETGECFSCLHNTTGPNCEVCEPGFYGDATVGSADDCRICECPLGTTSNSFATSCALNSFNDLVCTCEEGYTGQRCERCADGFFGNPTQLGDYCTRCTCSGNIDHSVNGSCDSVTGQCLKCTNDATGDQCDRCLPGYYGDVVVAKNCARCACNECGTVTAVCNHTIGACQCKRNVIGDGCDSCKPNTWNFDSCLGCEDCDCSAVSLSPLCDVKTGQCHCPDGVTGRKCDRCKAGYFNYLDAGCQPCNCGGRQGAENLYGFCDINTGKCCKWGGNCTICPENYILTSEGCEYCGECVGRLLATATKLDNNLTLALKSLKQGTAGIIAEQRFTDINDTLQRLIPPTNKYNETMETVSHLVGVSSQNVTGSSHNVSQGGLIQKTESSEKTIEEVNSKVVEVTDKATKALANATFTKDDALALEQEIRDAVNRTQDTVDIAKKIANTLKTDKANQTLLLERAEDILKELVKQDFRSINATIIEEEELAMTLLNQAKTRLNDTMSLWSDLSEANKTLDELLGTFSTIKQKTSGILENASLAMDTNNISKSYDAETPLKDAMKRKEEVDISLVSLQEVINSTNFKLSSARSSLQAFNGSFPWLDSLIDQVNKRMANLSRTLNELTPSVLMAQNHSEELRKRADELDKLFTDIEFPRKAVNTSQRYSDIANALNESLAIAREAEEIAMDALDQAQNLSSPTRNSKARSTSLNKTASNIEDKVDSELASLLDDIKERLELIRAKIRKVSGDLTDVESNFPGFDELASRIGGRATDLENNATESKNIADDARQKAEEIESQLSGLSGLKELIIMTNGNITDAEKQVREALNKSSTIKEKVVVQEVRHEQIIEELDIEVKRRLDDIEGMLVRAHALLRYTPVVMKFDGETVIEPVLPPAIQKETRALDILLYAKPEKPDGLLLFVGDASNSDSNRQKRQSQQCGPDFAAVELRAAKPVLKMCTAQSYREFEAPENISTDGQWWYKVEAGMDGDQAKLSMKYRGTSNEDVTAVNISRSLEMNNPRMVFNENSKLIVGGVSMAMQLPDEISHSNYTGCVDGLQINHHYVGNWNSELIKPDKDGYCPTRSGVKEFTVPESEERRPDRTFFGTGYLKSGRYFLDPLRTFDFTFRTSSSNGILVIAVDGDKFQAVELSHGYILFSYNLGLGYRKIRSKKNYDTGKWYSVKKTSDWRKSQYSLTITKSDGSEEILAENLAENLAYYPGNKTKNWVNAEFVYWGGIENRTTIPENVTSKFFKGCLKDMSVSTGEITVLTSPGYIRGCHLKPAWNVTFLSDKSYLEKEPFLNRRTRGFTIGLSFQVPNATRHGLLFLEAHERDFIVLGLYEGKVIFKASSGSVPVTLQTDRKYNNGKWHFVTVHKDGLKVKLYVDMEEKERKFQDGSQQYIQTTQNMYLGGVPQDYTVMTKDFDSVILNSLKGGSIRHLTFNEKLFNFMDYLTRNSVIFDGDDYSEPTPKDLIIEKPVTNAPTATAPNTTNDPVDPLVSTSTAEVPRTSQLPTSSPSTTEVSDTPEPPTTAEPVITTTEGVQTTPTAASKCLMPQKPDQLTGVMGFGLDLNSHADYNIAGPLLKLKGEMTDLSFQFRASNPNGTLLYTANANQKDFLECHVEDGKVSCSFSAGGGILKLTSDEASYSDGNWHTVKLSRNTTTGTLYIDGREKDSGKAGGSSTSIDGLTKLFLGGVPDGFDNRQVPAFSRISLPGCIRNVTVDRKDIGPPTTCHKVQECYQGSPESEVSFEHGGGSLKVGENYSVGERQEIMLEIKPTSDTGLLLSSSSSKDYIVLEMDRGNVIFRAENGGGQLVVEYSSEDPQALCDGNWHKIQASKDGNLVRLKVDDGPEREGGGKGSQTEVNIYNPLYAGGLPEGLVGKGVTVNESYTGCMRNLVSRSPGGSTQRLSLTNPVMKTGNVFLGGCPYT